MEALTNEPSPLCPYLVSLWVRLKDLKLPYLDLYLSISLSLSLFLSFSLTLSLSLSLCLYLSLPLSLSLVPWSAAQPGQGSVRAQASAGGGEEVGLPD